MSALIHKNGYILVSRNLKDKPFSINSEDCLIIKQKIKKLFKSATFMDIGDMPVNLIKDLLANEIISTSFTSKTDAFIVEVDSKKGVYIIVGDDNVLSISAKVFDIDLYSAYDKIASIEQDLCQEFDFAFSNDYGYLTVDPTKAGTALKAYLNFNLPNISMYDKFDELVLIAKENGFDFNVKRQSVGVYALKNNVYMGVSEYEILSSIKQFALSILAIEDDINNNFNF